MMNKFFKNAALLSMGCMVAVSMVSCHTGEDTQTEQYVIQSAIKNSVRVSVFDQDGAVLNGANVKINNTNYATGTSNVVDVAGLGDGNYKIEVTKADYIAETAEVDLKVVVVDGQKVGANKEVSVYLTKEVTEVVTLGSSSNTKSLVVESSKQNVGGEIVGNTQDPSNTSLNSEVVVEANTPALNAAQVAAVESQLGGSPIASFAITLSNLTTTKAEAAATRAIQVVGDGFGSVGQNSSFFTGVVLTTTNKVDLTSLDGVTVAVSFDFPDNNVKNAMKVYRRVDGKIWTAVTASTTGNGIASVDFNADKKIVINLNVIENQEFALGMLIDVEDEGTESIAVSATPIVNNTGATMKVSSMDYTAKSGVVLQNEKQSALVDYLRKIVLRSYNLTSVESAQTVTRTYKFSPVYSLPAEGTLYLAGGQVVSKTSYSAKDGDASFDAVSYGDVLLYPYHIAPVTAHIGGGND